MDPAFDRPRRIADHRARRRNSKPTEFLNSLLARIIHVRAEFWVADVV